MQELLSYTFFQHALLAAVLVSIATGIIGSLIVVNRMVFLAGGIAHASYGGIGLALFFGLPIFLGTSIFSIIVAIIIALLTLKNREFIDTYIGLIWAVGMAIGIVFIDKTSGYSSDLLSYLFGSILTVSKSDLLFMSAIVLVIIMIVSIWYRKILAISYDMEYAGLLGINVKFYYTLILVLSSLTIVIAIKVVGLILVIALLTIPTFIASKLSSSLSSMMILSSLFSILFTVIGLVASYYLDITSGASIILTSAIFFVVFNLLLQKRF
jgi:zinc transport system permease protein